MKRKDVKNVLKMLSLDDEAEMIADTIDELRELYAKKLAPLIKKMKMSPEDALDYVEKYLVQKLAEIGIKQEDVEDALDKLERQAKRVAVNLFEGIFDEVDRISFLKDELKMKEIDDFRKELLAKEQQLGELNGAFIQYKKDYRAGFEKALRENREKLDKQTVDRIKQEGVEEYIKKMKAGTIKPQRKSRKLVKPR